MPGESAPSFGYTILYVEDVAATLDFYEQAFGLARRFFHDEGGKSYGELETGATRLAFGRRPVTSDPAGAPLAFEIALVTDDVDALYNRALGAGAAAVSAPAVKPWGQTVAYVRDRSGYLVELCTAVG